MIFSGFVNVSYAIPNPDLKLVSVKQRAFLGLKPNEKQFKYTVNYFTEKHTDLINIIVGFKPLSNSTRKELVNYLNEFYAAIDSKIMNNEIEKWTNFEKHIEKETTTSDPSLFRE